MSLKLVIVRHGRTAWNRENRLRGRMDLPLDDVGQAQARAAGRAIGARWPGAAAVYSSPLLRARQTAEPIAAALGRPVQPHSGLLDIDYGRWGGLTPEEIAAQYPERYQLWQTAPHRVYFPAGESLAQVQERLLRLLDELAQGYAGQTIVLVGHIVVNRVLLCTVLGLGLEAFRRIEQDNGAINVIGYDQGDAVVHTLNDTCHLREALQ